MALQHVCRSTGRRPHAPSTPRRAHVCRRRGDEPRWRRPLEAFTLRRGISLWSEVRQPLSASGAFARPTTHSVASGSGRIRPATRGWPACCPSIPRRLKHPMPLRSAHGSRG